MIRATYNKEKNQYYILTKKPFIVGKIVEALFMRPDHEDKNIEFIEKRNALITTGRALFMSAEKAETEEQREAYTKEIQDLTKNLQAMSERRFTPSIRKLRCRIVESHSGYAIVEPLKWPNSWPVHNEESEEG